MIETREIAPDTHEILLSGLVVEDDIAQLETWLRPLLEDAPHRLSFVIRIEAFEDITGPAILRDARVELSMMHRIDRIARVAVVTDKYAFQAITAWIDPLFPMVRLSAFPSADLKSARAWATEAGQAADTSPDTSPASSSDTPDTTAGLHVLEDGRDGPLVFEFFGRVTEDDVDRVFDAFQTATTTTGATTARDKIDMMAIIREWEAFEWSILSRDLMTDKFAAMGKLRRYAVVGGPAWMTLAVQALNPVLPIEMKTFDLDDLPAARAWLGS